MRRALLAALVLALPACSKSDSTPTPTPQPSPTPGACGAGAPVEGTPPLASVRVAQGLQLPLDVQVPAGDRERLFVVEQSGRVRIVRGGVVQQAPFLDLSSKISFGGERGLLGLAFHPSFAQNGRLFVNYTDRGGDTKIAEYRVSSNPDVADPASEAILLGVDQPFPNHNGGGLAFGNDGMLYIGLGDGGGAGDPNGNAQNLHSRLGKMLRIDVDHGTPYAIPPDNPFVSLAGAAPEIWALGLRNPWRFAFDRASGDLYIGDVGQDQVEEVDFASGSLRGGQNYGWNVMEGSRCYRPASGCDASGLTLPVYEYSHADGCAVTGGVVYRGCRMPGYRGTYFFADYCSGFIRSFRLQSGQATEIHDWTASLGRGIESPVAFGTDADGEMYIVDHNGEVYKIVPAI